MSKLWERIFYSSLQFLHEVLTNDIYASTFRLGSIQHLDSLTLKTGNLHLQYAGEG